jgi:hypothetical protein
VTGTWGLPGSAFLWLFVAVSVAVTAGTLVRRRRIFRGVAE